MFNTQRLVLWGTLLFSVGRAVRLRAIDEASGGAALDATLQSDSESEFVKSLYGSMKCDDAEREEFRKIFGHLPGSDLSGNLWSSVQIPDDPESRKKVIYLYPANDHNGAFNINDHMCYRLLSFARLHPDTKMIHINTVKEARRILESTPEKSIKHLVVGGHGSPQSLSFGSCSSVMCRLKIYTPSAKAFFELAKTRLTTDGRVFLDSCLNGKDGEGHNMAMYASKFLEGHRVFSSQISFSSVNFVVTDFKQFNLQIISDKDEEKKKLDVERNFINVQNCETWPLAWTDTDGRDCKTYEEGGLCSTMAETKSASGVTAAKACCQCGGGRTKGFVGRYCPDFATEIPGNGNMCECKDPDALCYKRKERTVGCHNPNPKIFSIFDGSNVECRTPQSCPESSHASYFSKHDSSCSCPAGWLCFQGGRTEPGCPGKAGSEGSAGSEELRKFHVDCIDCKCKPTNHPTVACTGGLCHCPSAMKCYNGDTEGCPTQTNYAELAAKGPILMSTTAYAESCTFCNCRLLCKGAATNQAGKEMAKKLSSPDGQCVCGVNATCTHGEKKSADVIRSWGISNWSLKDKGLLNGVEAGQAGFCPWPHTTLLGGTYIDMFACPDCYCAYSGAKTGAATEKGSRCHIGWNLNGKHCDREDGCCNIDNDKKGPWCPTIDPAIGIGSFGDGAFRYDRCTAVNPPPTAKWIEASEKVCQLSSSKKKCGIGHFIKTFECIKSGVKVDEEECLQFAPKPDTATKEPCYMCDCAFNYKAKYAQCADWCKESLHCEYSSCIKCPFCLELQQICAANMV